MKRLAALFNTYRKITRSERLSLYIAIILFSVPMIITSVVYLNGTFTNKTAAEGYGTPDVTFRFDAPLEEGTALKTRCEPFFDSIKEKGGSVNIQMSVRAARYDGAVYTPLNLRFFEDYNYDTPPVYNDLSGKCIVNLETANKLNIKSGGSLKLDFLESPLQILRAMPSDIVSAAFEDTCYVTLDSSLLHNALAFYGSGNDTLNWVYRIYVDGLEKFEPYELFEIQEILIGSEYKYEYALPTDLGLHMRNSIAVSKETPYLIAVVCLTIGMFGILALLNLKEARLIKQNAVLRLIGMSRSDGVALSVFDAGVLSVTACVIGTLIGSVIFFINSEQMTGAVLTVPELLPESVVLLLINTVMCFTLTFACHLWMYGKIFSRNIAAILQNRRMDIKGLRPLLWLAAGWLVYSLIAFFVFSSTLTLIFLLVTLFILLLSFILFSLTLTALKLFRFKVRNIWSAAFVFMTRRVRFIAVTGTVAVVLSLGLIVLYDFQFGFARLTEEITAHEISLNTAVVNIPQNKLDTVKSYLRGQGYEFVATYTKWIKIPGQYDPINLGVINDERDVTNCVSPKEGSFFAADYLIHRNALSQVNEGLYEFSSLFSKDAAPLTLTRSIAPLPWTSVHSSTLFNVGLNYEDAREYIDDSFDIGLSLLLNDEQRKELSSWARANQLRVETADYQFAGASVTFFNIIFIFLLAIALLFITVLVFFFSLSHASVLSRSHEILMYKMQGAGKRQINIMLIMENLYIAISATFVALLFDNFLMNQISHMIANVSSYRYGMPVYAALVIFLITLTASFVTSWAAAKIISASEPVNLLRGGINL